MLIIKSIDILDRMALDQLKAEVASAEARFNAFLDDMRARYGEEPGIAVSFEGEYVFLRDEETARELQQIELMRRLHHSLIAGVRE